MWMKENSLARSRPFRIVISTPSTCSAARLSRFGRSLPSVSSVLVAVSARISARDEDPELCRATRMQSLECAKDCRAYKFYVSVRTGILIANVHRLARSFMITFTHRHHQDTTFSRPLYLEENRTSLSSVAIWYGQSRMTLYHLSTFCFYISSSLRFKGYM
jgi:hypothetical protein